MWMEHICAFCIDGATSKNKKFNKSIFNKQSEKQRQAKKHMSSREVFKFCWKV